MTTKAQANAERIEANQRAAFSKKVRNQLGHVIVQQSKLDEVFDSLKYKNDYGDAADALANQIAAQEPVGLALHPQKVEAIKAARIDAQKVVDKARATLEAHNWDLDAVAPRGNSITM